jgi:predicted lipoprotein with Yx(FWY)xxD motif
MAEMASKSTASDERPQVVSRHRRVVPVSVLAVTIAIAAGIGVAVAQQRPAINHPRAACVSSNTVVCVNVATVKVGTVSEKALVNGKGFALYHLKGDTANGSNCTGPCLAAWPALSVPAGAKLEGGDGVTGLKTVTRPGGQMQAAYQGEPLYTFATDTTAGVATGNNVANFFVVTPKAASCVSSKTVVCVNIGNLKVGTKSVKALVNGTGFALYHRAKDPKNGSSCTGVCLQNWPALTVPKGAKLEGGPGVTGLGTFKRSNGAVQALYHGEALYRFKSDTKPGVATGNGIGGFSLVKPITSSTTTTTKPATTTTKPKTTTTYCAYPPCY